MKKYILIAGVNGAGKSTLYRTLESLQQMKRVNSVIKNIEYAKSHGYKVEIHYVGVESVEIAKERIAYRVEHGGHGIPDVDVERRYIESFKQLNKIKAKCDLIVLFNIDPLQCLQRNLIC